MRRTPNLTIIRQTGFLVARSYLGMAGTVKKKRLLESARQGAQMKLDLLAIAAHPDDAELTCGGTLIKMARRGYKTGILDLTAGEMGTRGTPETRTKEAAKAAKLLGIAWRDTLGVPDSDVQPARQHKLRLDAGLRRLLPGRLKATAARRGSLPPVQNPVLHVLRRSAPQLCSGHYQGIRAAPQSHPGLCLAIPPRQSLAQGQSLPGHRSPRGRNEPVGPPLRPNDRGEVRRAISDQGIDAGRGRGGDAGALDLSQET